MPELKDLTLRGMVAYAVRCAMRVRPLYVGELPETVDQAIRDASDFCLGIGLVARGAAALAAATKYAVALADAALADAAKADDDTAALAAKAAADAADAAEAKDAAATVAAATVAAEAAEAAFKAAAVALPAAEAVVVAAIYATTSDFDADLEALVRLRLGNPGELGEPIDPSEDGPLGPLWRDGEPPSIEIYIDPGDASKETIQSVLDALSDLHVAAGGLGLEYTIDGQFVVAAQEVTS